MSDLIEQLIAFARKHEPSGGFFGPETLVDHLEANSSALAEFKSLFANADAVQFDSLQDNDEYGWIIAGAADELDLFPDDPRLFKSSAELDEIPDDKLLGELCSACIVNDVNAVQYIASRLDVNALDQHKQTPLGYAIGNNHINCVEILLANGADPNIVENWGNNAMQLLCVYHVFKRNMELLIQHGGNPDKQNDSGETAVDQLRNLKRTNWMT